MIEANKAKILRRMEMIRKHLARIDELIQGVESKEDLWYPPEDPAFSPWIEYSGKGLPITENIKCEILFVEERKSQNFTRACASAGAWNWDNLVAAYRVRR